MSALLKDGGHHYKVTLPAVHVQRSRKLETCYHLAMRCGTKSAILLQQQTDNLNDLQVKDMSFVEISKKKYERSG